MFEKKYLGKFKIPDEENRKEEEIRKRASEYTPYAPYEPVSSNVNMNEEFMLNSLTYIPPKHAYIPIKVHEATQNEILLLQTNLKRLYNDLNNEELKLIKEYILNRPYDEFKAGTYILNEYTNSLFIYVGGEELVARVETSVDFIEPKLYGGNTNEQQ